uniref:non-specific serine/threonine protein kinase n=1 Tax=Amphiprion percula TaxID=161767 RepID=A0A3P8TUF3_AMPPE
MPRFQEVEGGQTSIPAGGSGGLVAKRYNILQSLGRGSFGSVYLVQDVKATDGEELKVLKQIPLGDLRPDETVRATQEAQLLSQLHHPAILSFHHSFLERDAFCIITEYCQDRDLDCKLQEVKRAGRSLPENQVIDWLIQLLLGLHYMHDRRILHRDLKAKNVFLKRNLVKIGDFGVSCLLMGSCDLATTFTGTPFYMSPEVLNHQGYDSKSDIWQTKVHLQTLRDRSEVEKMTPRERMRLRKLQTADEKAKRLRKLAEEKYEEVHTRRRELRSRHFEKVSLDVLNVRNYFVLFWVHTFRPHTASLYELHLKLGATLKQSTLLLQPIGDQRRWSLSELANQQPGSPEYWRRIPEDPQAAEVYYNQDRFDSCSEDEESPAESLYLSDPQVNDSSPSGLSSPSWTPVLMCRPCSSISRRLGSEVFQKLYENLKEARRQRRDAGGEDEAVNLQDQPDDGFQVDQLLFYEEELQRLKKQQDVNTDTFTGTSSTSNQA